MTVGYALLDGIIAAARTVNQYDLVASEKIVSGSVTIDFTNGSLSQTMLLDENCDLVIIPPKLPIPKTAVIFRLFVQHADPTPFAIGNITGIDGYFGAAPVWSTTASARDLLAMSYDNGIYGGVWGMFTQGTPV